jgi:protein-S-isoprenylcysteine O-methyltransferase Ste14
VSDPPVFVQLLARFRVALGWVVGPLVLIVAEPTAGSLLVGMGIAALGETLRIWAAGHLNKAREVTTSGPYRWLRHPLYVGSSIMGLGLGIASHNLIVIALIALYLSLTLRAAIRSEDAFLRRTFGDEYEQYRRRTGNGRAPATRRFSVSQAIANHEHRAVIGYLIAFLLLALKATYNGSFWRPDGP